MASEVGRARRSRPRTSLKKGRLEPGKMFLVDLEQGRIVDDEELKHQIASAKPYGKWLARVHGPAGRRCPPRADVSRVPTPRRCSSASRRSATRSKTSSTSSRPMGTNGEEAIGSMGNDTPLAVLSDRAQPLFNYFKQLFAQVTNPPLDAIREELVTSVFTGAGGEGNLLDADARSRCRQIALDMPDHRQRRAGPAQAARRLARVQVGHACRCSSWPPRGPRAWSEPLEALFAKASAAIEDGASLIILSDRGVNAEMAADPVAAGLLGPAPPPGPPGPAHREPA